MKDAKVGTGLTHEFDPDFPARDVAGVLVQCLKDRVGEQAEVPHFTPAKIQNPARDKKVGVVYIEMVDGRKYRVEVTPVWTGVTILEDLSGVRTPVLTPFA